MADQEQVERLLAGVEGWNRWRKENPEVRISLLNADLRSTKLQNANLRSADLHRADLQSADLRSANLRSANLRSANLYNADLLSADLHSATLHSANLHSANLHSANLHSANLYNANLRRTNLDSADLQNAKLHKADLHSANLQSANLNADLRSVKVPWVALRSTVLGDVDLRGSEGLEQVRHHGPSIVDHRTLAKSRGWIPEIFLRGCGFQDWEIEAAKLHDPNLSDEQVTDIGYRVIDLKSRGPIQINPVFISYSRGDSSFVEAVEPLLDGHGIRYWRDVHDMTAGPLDEQIERAIRLNPTYLLVLSEQSIRSDWVEWEAQKARELEKELRRQGEDRHVLCPVALDDSWKKAAWPKPLKHQIQKYNILDFSQWRDREALWGMFSRLLDGLGIYYRSDGE